MRPPVCDICDVDVDPAGGLVTFQPDDASRDWRRRAEEERFVGHPPDTGWFCSQHVDAAKEAATTLTYTDGVRHVRTLGIDAPPPTPPTPAPTPPLGPASSVDLLDPAPDLVGADLGAGRLAADDRFRLQWVEWDLDGVDVGAFERAVLDAMGDLLAAAGLGRPPSLATTTKRTWEPMDGAQPPFCPFTDTTVHEGERDGVHVRVRTERVHWNDDDVNSSSVSLTVRDHVSVSASAENGGGRRLSSVRLYRPTTGAVVQAIDDLLGRATDVR